MEQSQTPQFMFSWIHQKLPRSKGGCTAPAWQAFRIAVSPVHPSLILLLPCLYSFCHMVSRTDYPVPWGWENGHPCIALWSHLGDCSCTCIITRQFTEFIYIYIYIKPSNTTTTRGMQHGNRSGVPFACDQSLCISLFEVEKSWFTGHT